MQYRLKKFILYQQWRNVDPDPLPVTSICSGREFIMFPDLPTRYSLQSGSYLQLHLADGRTHRAGQPSSMKEDQFWHLSKMSRDWSARNCAAKHKVVLVYPVVSIASSHGSKSSTLCMLEQFSICWSWCSYCKKFRGFRQFCEVCFCMFNSFSFNE